MGRWVGSLEVFWRNGRRGRRGRRRLPSAGAFDYSIPISIDSGAYSYPRALDWCRHGDDDDDYNVMMTKPYNYNNDINDDNDPFAPWNHCLCLCLDAIFITLQDFIEDLDPQHLPLLTEDVLKYQECFNKSWHGWAH